MDITTASYCITAQGGTIGGHYSQLLYCSPLVDTTTASYTVLQPKGGPLVNIIAATYYITAQGGTIGGHYRSHLLYRSPRGDHWWTLPWPLTVLQPKGGPLVDITTASYCIAAQGGTIGGHYSQLLYCSPLVDTTTASYTVLQPKGGPLVNITAATYYITAQGGTIGGHYRSHLLYRSPRGDHWWTLPWPLTVLQPKGGPLVDITTASYCIAAQGGTIGGHYSQLLYYSPRGDHWWTLPQPLTVSQPKGGPLVDTTMATYCIVAQGGTIGGHHYSQLLYCSPRGDHWWTLQPVTVLQPKGGPLVDTTTATYCITAQGGTIGEHYRSHLLYRSPRGGPLVDTTMATYCIAAQGGTIGGHYRSHLLYHSPRGDHWWTLPWPLTVL